MTWEPIETAPKDRPIIAWNGGYMAIVEWEGGTHWKYEGFFLTHKGADSEDARFRDPTHWHPCPSPPQ